MACTVPTPRRVFAPAALTILASCAPPGDSAPRSFAEGCTLDTATTRCDDCLELEHQLQIGSVDGPGFLSEGGDRIVRDGSGNYWIGERERMNVHGPDGEFIRTVGREGEGPMEFGRAYPFHSDAAGRVHVWDPLNLRVSIVTPEFALVDEKPISGLQINDMIAIDDGDLYVMQSWSRDPANLGQPVHIVDGREVVSSFGKEYASTEDAADVNPLESRRLAATPGGAIMVAHRNDHLVEAWSRDGQLLGSVAGPDLGIAPFEPGPVTPDNPPPNFLTDMHVDAAGRVWVFVALRRPDWLDNSEEVPQVGLMPVDMNPINWVQSRIELRGEARARR